jgi:dipeptidyl aminopeptidase/acylaminoacyl peptidase
LSWSPDARALLFERAGSAGSRAWVINAAAGSQPVEVGDSEAAAPAWSPAGDFLLFTRADEDGYSLWIQSVSTQAPSPQTQELLSANQAVKRFMEARIAKDEQAARRWLAGDAPTTYSSSDKLVGPGSPRLGRYYVVSDQPSRKGFDFRVRVVQRAAKDREVGYFEESLRLEKQGSDYRIVSAEIFPAAPVARGPSVVMLAERALGNITRIVVTFDSDLDSASISDQTIALLDSNGERLGGTQVVFSPLDHTVRITVPRPLSAGDYSVRISTQVRDISGQPLGQEYSWTFSVPGEDDE